jgi:hypothetical protein
MWLFNTQPSVGTPFPLGPQPANRNAPFGTGQHGGAGATDYRHSSADLSVVNAPKTSFEHTRKIRGGVLGESGNDLLIGAYTPYAKRIAVYTQASYASAEPWQSDQYYPEERPLLRQQRLGIGQYYLYQAIQASRPPINELDYNLGQMTPDSAMQM